MRWILAAGDPVLGGPEDGLVVVLFSRNIRKRTGTACRSGRTGSPPEEGHDLSPRAVLADTEAASVCSACDSGAQGPED